jgi:Aspartyl protease
MPSVRFDPTTGHILVIVYLHGPHGRFEGSFLVDTGSQVTSVDPDLVAGCGYRVRDGKRLSRLVGPGDSSSLGWVLRTKAFEAFDILYDDFEVHVHDQPREDGIDGLLGMDWLLRHVMLINGPGGSIEVTR